MKLSVLLNSLIFFTRVAYCGFFCQHKINHSISLSTGQTNKNEEDSTLLLPFVHLSEQNRPVSNMFFIRLMKSM